ncbi:hypothetical protein AB0J68_25835 [Micromonospora sp. NPDC049580]|uniref:hypothetical protein n=1 Tax=Micromonospora sp. NPDC049580 TaxID=3154832 RepID=UPI00343ED25B
MAALSLTGAGLLADPATAAPTAQPSPRPTLTTEQPPAVTAPSKPAPTTPAPGRATAGPTTVVGLSAACGGHLPLGQVKNCASIAGAAQQKWTITSTVDQDTLFIRLREVSGDGVGAQVKGGDGTTVCYVGPYLTECKLGAAGTYTVTVTLDYGTGKGAYSLSAESMRTPSTCVSLPASFFSFASAGRSGTLPVGLAARCFTFKQPTGTVLHLADPGGVEDIQGNILDAQFQPVCSVRYPTECTLREAGPYRLFLEETYGNKAPYTLKMPRISQSVGCPALPLTAFGDPGAAVGTGTVPPNQGIGCQSLRVTTPGRLIVRLDQYANQYLDWRLYDDAGQVVCTEYDSSRSCAVPAAGAYTLVAQNWNWEPVTYRVAAARLDQTEGCAAPTGLNWDQPALTVHQTSAVQTNCQPFHGEAGERVMVYRAPDRYNDVSSSIVDEQGAVLCTDWSEQDGCVLPSTGTYRVVSYLANWDADSVDLTYKVQVRRLSEAVGCPTITPGTYNSAPAGALGGIRCRTLDLPSAGVYRVTAVDGENYRSYATVYDSAGIKVCTDTWCEVPAAGKYTMVLSGGVTGTVIDTDFRYAVALLPWKPSDCTPVSDTGWQDAPHRGGFDAAGQHNCLQLPSPAGAHVAELLAGDVTAATSPEISVLNAAGEQVCDYSSLRQYSCELTGEAPFSVLLTADEGSPTSSYAVGFARTDGPPACPVLPGDAAGATVTTGADHFAVCYTVPADQRASRESFTWTRTAGSGDARMSVFDSQGIRYCGPGSSAVERTITCTLPAGPVTVILETDAVDASYRLTHRDGTAPTA